MPPWRWPSDEKRVQDRARVVAGDEADEADRSGVGIDLDHRHVGPEGERRARSRSIPCRRRAARRTGPRDPASPVRSPGCPRRGTCPRRPRHRADRPRGGRHELTGGGQHRVGRLHDGRAPDLQRARSIVPSPRHRVGVAVDDPHLRRVDPEAVGDQHRERGETLPWGDEPVRTVADPSGSMRTEANSFGAPPPAVIST